ncbi:hypothetical protein PanWU01x14_260870 [Parasponia andersonii]|uniref:Uncharacterized protein n=1 Tax=Parasponia andersonii TaxID=3476 RepID=A0A2P5B8M3_PARAD|nr:hypothetical protein PanWU01x14_260870 [Parasponia andersonii]
MDSSAIIPKSLPLYGQLLIRDKVPEELEPLIRPKESVADSLILAPLRKCPRGASLDMFENALDVLQELCALENVVLSPHKLFIPKSCKNAIEIVIINLKAFFSNKSLLSLITYD